jgi:hypothetical protein
MSNLINAPDDRASFSEMGLFKSSEEDAEAISASGENSIMDRNLIVIFHLPHEGGDAISRK